MMTKDRLLITCIVLLLLAFAAGRYEVYLLGAEIELRQKAYEDLGEELADTTRIYTNAVNQCYGR